MIYLWVSQWKEWIIQQRQSGQTSQLVLCSSLGFNENRWHFKNHPVAWAQHWQPGLLGLLQRLLWARNERTWLRRKMNRLDNAIVFSTTDWWCFPFWAVNNGETWPLQEPSRIAGVWGHPPLVLGTRGKCIFYDCDQSESYPINLRVDLSN